MLEIIQFLKNLKEITVKISGIGINIICYEATDSAISLKGEDILYIFGDSWDIEIQRKDIVNIDFQKTDLILCLTNNMQIIIEKSRTA